MKRLLTALFCLAGLASAQTATPPPDAAKPKWIQKVIDVKYADPTLLADLLGYLTPGDLDPRLNRVKPQTGLHAISIGTYDPSFLKLAEEIIKRYDVPNAAPAAAPQQHGVEIVAHILLAGPKGSSGDALPADLEPVAKQLRSVFGYTDMRLLDSALIRGREARRSEVTGILSGLAEGSKGSTVYHIVIKNVSLQSAGKGNSIVLEDFKFYARVPYEMGQGPYQVTDVGFDTDLNVLEGQKVVVGKSRMGASNEALILVVSARVVE